MKIGELARGSGLKASAIRYYEKRGLILPPHRMGGQRRYAKEALDRVLLIRFASDMGFSLSEIKLFLDGCGTTPRLAHVGGISPAASSKRFGTAWNARAV